MPTERTYNIPLRKIFLRVPKHRRTKRAMNGILAFLTKHMKSDNIKIGKQLNLKMWEHGIKNPPHHIKVTVIKEDDGTVKAELFGAKKEEKKANKERKPKTAKKITKQETKPTDKNTEEVKKTFPEQEKPAKEATKKTPQAKSAKVREEARKKE